MSQQIRKIVPSSLYPNHFSNITFKTTFSNCVYQALLSRQWNQHESGQWNLQWCEKQRINDVFDEGVSGHQRVNHFRLYTQLCRKDMLMKNIRKFRRQLAKEGKLNEQEWRFMPETFFLPSQYVMFVDEFKKNGGLWIMKPTSRCQGAGIFIIDRLQQVAPYKNKVSLPQPTEAQIQKQNTKAYRREKQMKEEESSESSEDSDKKDQMKGDEEGYGNQSYIIQKYLESPLLFGGKKFDLRIYVLCTDYRNLTVWLYRSGFARFTHEPYSSDDTENLGGHLTNVQIQKHSDHYDAVRGGKWLLRQFKLYLISRYSRKKVNLCFDQIRDIILKSLMAVQRSILPSKSSFELYGYDFMIDSRLKPWLIEVNGGPSMTANTEFDFQLKCGLVDDVLSIIDLQGILGGEEMTIGGFDQIMKKDIPVRSHRFLQQGCALGARNQRKKIMRDIGKRFMLRKEIEGEKERERKEKEKELQKENKRKEEKRQQEKKQKRLPNFYYRKKRDIDDESLALLKKQLQYLENELEEFIPLKQY